MGRSLLLAWLFWALDFNLRPLMAAFLFRAGESTQPVTLGELFAAQELTYELRRAASLVDRPPALDFC